MATSSVVVEMETKDGEKSHVSIPISYKPHAKVNPTKPKKKSMKTMDNEQTQRDEQLLNKQILFSTKRGYSVLLLITLLLLIVLTLYVVEVGAFRQYLYNGVTSCCISLILMIPTFILYRHIEKKVIFQHDTINNKIVQTFSLKQQIEAKLQQNMQQAIDIDSLKIMVAEQEQRINKLCSKNDNEMQNAQQFHLIQGFRRGQMEIQIECAKIHELVAMLNVVVACITLLPFGQTPYRTRLTNILQNKIDRNKYLQMHFYFFLLSYLECTDVKRLFRKHRIMRKVKLVADHYDYQKELEMNDGASVFSDDDALTVNSAPFTPYSPDAEFAGATMNQFPAFQDDHAKVVYFKEKDPIKLFRAPIDNKAQPGLTIIVPKELQNRFFDPINGNKLITQLVVRAIFQSNTKPYLVDCYVKDKGLPKFTAINEETSGIEADAEHKEDPHEARQYAGMILSSTFILKKGDDLRKDQAILQMMHFMNDIWRENNLKYQNSNYYVQCLIYKCIPMGNDVGIIEMIGDCIELNNVLSLKTKFMGNITEKDELNARDCYHRLVSTAAAAYIASFVCGIRDRHHDNVLIETHSCTLFHIDFGYIFNDTTTLDTAKFAITSDLKKVFNSYKNGWENFIDIACKSWMILRQNATELIDFARVAFAFLYKSNDIEQFLRNSLKIELHQEEALKYIYNHISKAPNKWRTKMKNLTHTFAQKMKHKKKSSGPLQAPRSRSQRSRKSSEEIQMSKEIQMSIQKNNTRHMTIPNHHQHHSPRHKYDDGEILRHKTF